MACSLLAACATAPVAPAGTPLFTTYSVDTANQAAATVVPGFFLGGSRAELAVISADAIDNRRLLFLSFDGNGWTVARDFPLPSSVLFVDVARIGGHDWLVTLEHDRIQRIDPASGSLLELLTVETSWGETDNSQVARIDVFQDLTGNGLDDLAIPAPDGFRIATQAADGSFSEPIKIGPPEPYAKSPGLDDSGVNRTTTYGQTGVTPFNLPLYQSRLHRMDHNRDGRADLAFWNGQGFDLYYQDRQGTYSQSHRRVPCAVPIDSDGLYTRIFDFKEDGVFAFLFGSGQASSRTVLHAIIDMNNDGIEDLVTLTITGRSPIRQRSRYAVHPGAVTNGVLEFQSAVSASIQPRGMVVGVDAWGYSSNRLADINADGFVDLALVQVNIGLAGMFRALIGNSASVTIEVYRSKHGGFPPDPSAIRHFGWTFERGSFFPPILGGDVTGDGLHDLLIGRRRDQLEVYPGVSGPAALAEGPHTVTVLMPDDGRHVSLFDINGDGRQDLLLNRVPTPSAPDSRHGITTLISR